MKILYCDMDGVIADFEGTVKKYHPNLSWANDEVEEACNKTPNIFRFLYPIKNAINNILFLKDFYDIYFLSTPMYSLPESYMDKRIWLQNNVGEWCAKRLILTHRKDLNVGDYLIDDRLTNGSENFKGKLLHIGSSEYPNWDVILKELIENI